MKKLMKGMLLVVMAAFLVTGVAACGGGQDENKLEGKYVMTSIILAEDYALVGWLPVAMETYYLDFTGESDPNNNNFAWFKCPVVNGGVGSVAAGEGSGIIILDGSYYLQYNNHGIFDELLVSADKSVITVKYSRWVSGDGGGAVFVHAYIAEFTKV